MTFAAVILAGGKSRRMGEDKAQLKIGGRSFTEILAHELSVFGELYISVAEPKKLDLSVPQLFDPFPDGGPLSGLCAGLESCAADAALFVPCDTPFFTAEAGQKLCTALSDEYDGVMAISSSGRSFPLCAVYKKCAAAVFRRTLESGQKRVIEATAQLRIRQVELPDDVLTNVNYSMDYQALIKDLKKNIFLTGERGVGKSGIVKNLLSLLEVSPSGYCTEFWNRSAENRRLCIYPAWEAPCFDDEHTAAFFGGAPQVTDKFDSLGSEYLAADGELVIMDEIGKLEENSLKFSLAVKKVLDSSTPVLAVIRSGFPGWSAELAMRDDVKIITVTEENRNELPEQIARMFSFFGLKRRKNGWK